MVLNPVSRSLFKRDLKRWFGNPTGYVFITLFVLLATAALYWPNQFFQRNLANLDTLNDWFPLLLLFFVPAVTMNVWAGERGQGTDELLLTLPATDSQIVFGKFLAAAGIYTVALLFTFPVLFFLAFLGDPDWGLMLSNYFAFWLLGLALIAAGMVGSQLSDNLTVAFILGAVLCGVLVMFEPFLAALAPDLARTTSGFGPTSSFKEMARGVISLPSLLLYLGMIIGFLYLNLVLLNRRHWPHGGRQGLHFTVRFLAIAVSVVALTGMGVNVGSRTDLTSENVHTLSAESERLIDELPGDRPVQIQAYVSPEVSADFVRTRRTLLDLLRQYDAMGGDRIRVRIVPTEPFSDEAREAEESFGIRHQRRPVEEDGKMRDVDICLGVALTCGLEEVVIPFLDKGLSVEYELTRSMRVVAAAKRRTVGILDNELKVFGGFDFQRMRSDREWEIVRELKLQYDVEKVDPSAEYPDHLDALVALMPSALTQPQLDRLHAWIEAGNPTLLVDDPFPAAAPMLAPAEPKGGPQNPMMGQQQPPQEQKGDILAMLRNFAIDWVSETGGQRAPSVAWDAYNPFPQYEFDPELVFVGESASHSAFNQDQAVTAGLQQIVTIFGGAVREAAVPGMTFIPLLKTSQVSGMLGYSQLFSFDPFFGRSLNPRRTHRPDGGEKVLACRVMGKPGPEAPASIDLIFLADLDMISSQFFEMRRRGLEDMNFDNVTLLLNCVDQLAGDSSFIDLRKRRPQHRTLARIEEQEMEYHQSWLSEKEKAEVKAEADLAEARKRLDEKVKQIEQRTDLDEQSKAIQIESVRDVEQRRLTVREAAIEDDKDQQIKAALTVKLREQDGIRDFYRLGSVVLTPIPAILFGILSIMRRRRRERDLSRTAQTGGAA